MKKVAINNLGCSKNAVDGEKIAAYFASSGFSITSEFDQADIIVVNTCTFIQEATEESVQAIIEMGQWKHQGRCTSLIVSGCLSQRYNQKIKADLPEVDLWLGTNEWQTAINHYFHCNCQSPSPRVLLNPSASQYLKISDGCSHRCSFCIIPSVKGKFSSRSLESILSEASWLAEQGVRECILVSQNTSYYGTDQDTSLTVLLEKLLKKTAFPWIRLMYLHPNYIKKSLLDLVNRETRICSYFDIPLQHIAHPILRAMNRKPDTPKSLYKVIEYIRTHVSDATIRSSFILGFPGEKNVHFKQLLKFVEWARFEKLGVFPFSPEEGTKAFTLKPRPYTATAVKRCELLMELQKDISMKICQTQIGKKREIIIDSQCDAPEFSWEGRTRGDAPEIDGRVFLQKGDFSPGDIITVTINDADDYDLFV